LEGNHCECCVQAIEFYHLIPGICMTQRTKCFLGILYILSLSVVSGSKDDLLHL
jgi:hypothetical protein